LGTGEFRRRLRAFGAIAEKKNKPMLGRSCHSTSVLWIILAF
jgi:hypothetical protein